MSMRVGQKFRCQSPDCRSEIVVTEASMRAPFNPRCCCGGEMKKPYKKPTFQKMQFKSVEVGDPVGTED
jgi:hypothetical protein